MSKVLRRKMVDELTARYRGCLNFVLVDYRGLSGRQGVELRRDLRESGVRMNVLKNSVAVQTFEKLGLGALKDRLTGMNALVYGPDPVAIAKKLLAFREKTQKPEIRAALVEGQVFGPEQVTRLSKLPGREQLLGMLLGTLQGVTQKFVSTLNEIPRKFVGTLKAIQDKMEGKPAPI